MGNVSNEEKIAQRRQILEDAKLTVLTYPKNISQGVYIDYTDEKSTIGYLRLEDSAQKHISTLQKDCECCALGNLFLSFVKFHNNATLNEVLHAGCTLITQKMESLFDKNELLLIEGFYEGWKIRCFEEPQKIDDFYFKYNNPSDRMLAIIENMLANNTYLIFP